MRGGGRADLWPPGGRQELPPGSRASRGVVLFKTLFRVLCRMALSPGLENVTSKDTMTDKRMSRFFGTVHQLIV